MNALKKNLTLLLVAVLLMTMALTGCMSTSTQALANNKTEDNTSDAQTLGTLRLSVDNTPVVEIEYDAEGLVLSLKVAGEEGEEVVLGYGACARLTCREVASGLVVNMREAGYFDGEDGIQKKIILELVAGSQCPDDSFLEDIVEGVTKTVEGFNQPVVSTRPTPAPVATENPQPVETTAPAIVVIPVDGEHISLEEAKTMALKAVGLTEETEVQFAKEKLDRTDNKYELKFLYNGYEYEVELNAKTGEVMDVDKESTKHAAPDMSLRKITMEEAKAIALTKLGITTATFTEEEFDAYEMEYELEFTVNGREYAYTISAVNGDILEEKWENLDMVQPTPAPNASTLIGVATAKEQALKHAKITGKDVTYKEAKLDKEDGRYVYEIEFVYEGIEYEYEIDAYTGNILKAEKEKAD